MRESQLFSNPVTCILYLLTLKLSCCDSGTVEEVSLLSVTFHPTPNDDRRTEGPLEYPIPQHIVKALAAAQ